MFCVIYLPNFSLQSVLRHQPEHAQKPVALIDGKVPKATVIQMTSSAADAGIFAGMTSTQALARCSQVLIETRSLAREKSAQQTLLQTAYSFSPNIEETAPGTCTLDLKGLPIDLPSPPQLSPNAPTQTHRAGNPSDWPVAAAQWAAVITHTLSKFHLHPQVGIAATPELASCAAPCAAPILVVENSRDFLDQLRLDTAGLPPELLEIFHAWGIHTAAQLIGLNRNELSERLGATAVTWQEYLNGEKQRPLNLTQPPELFQESMEFQSEIETLEPLLFPLRRFIEQLAARLASKYNVAEALVLNLKLASGHVHHRFFRVPAPTSDVDILFRMLHTHLENLRTQSPIISLELEAKPALAEHHQFGLFEASLRDPNSFSGTIARLSAMFPPGRIGTPHLNPSHQPDDFTMEPVAFTDPPTDEPNPLFSGQETNDSTFLFGPALRRFRPPVPISVQCHHGTPAFFLSHPCQGKIARSSGPWRSSGNWWEKSLAWSREEWDVETEAGQLFRIVKDRDQWLLEGVFD